MILRSFWVVRNPGPNSDLSDVLMPMRSFTEFMNYTRGAQASMSAHDFDAECHVIHTNETSAKLDAEGRLKIQREADMKLRDHMLNVERKSEIELMKISEALVP